MFFLHDLFSSQKNPNSIKTMELLEDRCENFRVQNTSLLTQVQNLKEINENLVLKCKDDENTILDLRRELDDSHMKNIELGLSVEEVLIERDCLKGAIFAVKDGFLREEEGFFEEFDGFNEGFSRVFEILRVIKEGLVRVYGCVGREEDESVFELERGELKGMERLLEELEFVSRMSKRVEEKLSSFRSGFEVIELINVCLVKISDCLEVEKVKIEVNDECVGGMKVELSSFEDDLMSFSTKLDSVCKIVKRVENQLSEYQEKVDKDRRELESSVASLTEENRDINALFRIALVEKEALERSVRKLKGDNEQKSSPLLEFAGRSLQRVGFGFIMGGAGYEQQETQKKDGDQGSDNVASSSSVASDVSSENDEEIVNLAAAVENLMKNQRLEINQLRRALDETRSDSERLNSLTEKQARQIREQNKCIKELDDQKRKLTRNIEKLLIAIKSTEEDAERWREACELEVKAGRRAIQERDKLVDILKHELEKTRSELQVSNSRLKSKEVLVVAAMAAQSAAENSLQLADNRAVQLRKRIDGLTRQLEETGSKEKSNRIKWRRICWPWHHSDVRPEMEALLGRV